MTSADPPGDEPGVPDLAALAGGADSPLAGLLEQAQQMVQAQAEAASRQVEGVAGGGAVRITATGTGEVQAVSIAAEAVDPDDVPMLEDLVLAALHDLNAQLAAARRDALGGLGDLLGGGMPGADRPDG